MLSRLLELKKNYPESLNWKQLSKKFTIYINFCSLYSGKLFYLCKIYFKTISRSPCFLPNYSLYIGKSVLESSGCDTMYIQNSRNRSWNGKQKL